MAESPFRDRPLSPEEVRRVIERAASLSKVDVAAGKSGRPLTASELERHLRELGLEREVVRRAMDPVGTEDERVATTGLLEKEVTIESALGQEHFEEVAEVIASVMKMEGQPSAVGNKLTWTPGGNARLPAITVHVKDGATLIRYVEQLPTPVQAAISFSTLGVIAGLMATGLGSVGGVAIAKALEVAATEGSPVVFGVAGLLGMGAAVSSFVALWRQRKRHVARRAAIADEVVARLAAFVRERGAAGPKARVDTASASAEPESEEVEVPAGSRSAEN